MNWNNKRTELSVFLCTCLCLFFSTVQGKSELIDYSENCSAWSIETKNQSSDKKPIAGISCRTNQSKQASLNLSCHGTKIGVRYFGEQYFNNPTEQTSLKISYTFEDAQYIKSAIFINDSAHWTFFIPASEFDYPIFESLSSNKYLDIQLENSNVVERFSLNNSRQAITQLIENCKS